MAFNWGQMAGAAVGAIGGGKGQKSGGGMPKFVKKQIKRGYTGLNAAAERTPEQAIAPFNADQNAAFDMVRGNMGLGQGDIDLALAGQRRAAQGVTGADIASFYNPYEDQVIGSAMNDLNRQRNLSLLQIGDQAEKADAFGGDRAEVAKSLASEEYTRQMAQMLSGLRYNGYNAATDAAFRNNAALLAGSEGLLSGVDAQRTSSYKDAAALMGVGETLRGYDQTLLDYPLKMAQLQIDSGTGAIGGSAPTTSGGGISGAMAGALGGFDTFGKIFG